MKRFFYSLAVALVTLFFSLTSCAPRYIPLEGPPDGGYCAGDAGAECVVLGEHSVEKKPTESITSDQAAQYIPGRSCASDADCENASVHNYACLGGFCQLKSSSAISCSAGARDGRNMECRKYFMYCGHDTYCKTPLCVNNSPSNFKYGEEMCQPERSLSSTELSKRYPDCFDATGKAKCFYPNGCVGFFNCTAANTVFCALARCRPLQSSPATGEKP